MGAVVRERVRCCDSAWPGPDVATAASRHGAKPGGGTRRHRGGRPGLPRADDDVTSRVVWHDRRVQTTVADEVEGERGGRVVARLRRIRARHVVGIVALLALVLIGWCAYRALQVRSDLNAAKTDATALQAALEARQI